MIGGGMQQMVKAMKEGKPPASMGGPYRGMMAVGAAAQKNNPANQAAVSPLTPAAPGAPAPLAAGNFGVSAPATDLGNLFAGPKNQSSAGSERIIK
jgi:hypothetical protein